jgi:hypothetical protein
MAGAITKRIQAPVKGWNARDGLGGMKSVYAPIMDNIIPDTGRVRLRQGCEEFCSGMGSGAVESLIPYYSGTSSKLLACANDAIYEISTGTASSLATGLTSNRWQSVNFNGYVIMVNGADTPRKYDGSTSSTTSITGLTSSTLVSVNEYRGRLYFIQKDTLSAWYLGAGSISGAATQINLATLCKLGGTLTCMVTWTRDGGSGPDDLAVFITSMGEVLIYSGDNPATPWALVGRFYIAPPIGRRAAFPIGGDVVVITVDGFVRLSSSLPAARTEILPEFSNLISGAVNDATSKYKDIFGWEAVLYPQGRMGLFNVPIIANNTMHQYVYITHTQSWCRFTGWNANCFVVFNEELYYGGTAGSVFLADTGTSDDGSDIVGDVQQAFSDFGVADRKQFLTVRPAIASDGVVTPSVGFNVDYANVAATGTPSSSPGEGTLWDSSLWDTAYWGADELIAVNDLGVSGLGDVGAVRIRVSTSAVTFSWADTRVTFLVAA